MNSLPQALVSVAAVLALGAGVAKLARPRSTAVAFSAVTGLSHIGPGAVRIGAVAEGLIAAIALSGNRTGVLALGASYAAFAGFVVLALARGGPLNSCGCFGEPDVPPTWTHVAVNLTAVAACVLAARRPGPSPGLAELVGKQPLAGLPLVLLVAVVAGVLYVLLAELPRVGAVRPRRREAS